MRYHALTSTILAWAVVMGSCDLAEDDRYALHIAAPENDATFVDREDTDPNTDGMQISVRVETAQDGIPIELLRLVGGTPDVIGRGTTQNRQVTFPAITLFPGANRLSARDTQSGRTAPAITIYYEDPCGDITFLSPSPAPMDGELLLGPGDDVDGNACGESFAIALLAATGLPDGTRVSVLENGKRVASGLTRGGTLSIPQVPLERRNEAMHLALQVEGKACRPVAFPSPLRIDCEGPSCNIASLDHDALLTSRDDLGDLTPGLELNVTVQSNAEAIGQPVELVINGDRDNAYVAYAMETPDGSQAIFTNVALPDGPVRVRATCSDAAGARTTSQRSVTVDTVGCSLTVQEPTPGKVFVAQASEASRDIEVQATLGSDCALVRVAALASPNCAGLADAPAQMVTLGQTSLKAQVTLSAHGEQTLCVGAEDLRGNPSLVALPIRFENRAPALAFEEPKEALAVSRLGDDTRLADLDPTTRACEQSVVVSCENPGRTVSLVRVPDEVVLAQSACIGNRASFSSVPFPSQNNGESYSVVARMPGENGLVGQSLPLTVHADCDPPSLDFAAYTCGVTSLSAADDEDATTEGIQHTVRVTNTPNPKPAVSLTVRVNGGPASEPVTSTQHAGPETLFDKLTLPEGVLTLEACATDASGNHACTPACDLLVGDVPPVAITSPASERTLYSVDLSSQGVAYRGAPPVDVDCSPNEGLQIPIEAVAVGAEAGRPARVQLRSHEGAVVDEVSTSVEDGGQIYACLNTVEGSALVVRVEVDAQSGELYGAAERRIDVDVTPPTHAPTVTVDRPLCRGPSRLRFQGGTQQGTDELIYELRCAAAPIDNEAAWSSATPAPGHARPAGPTVASGLLTWELPDALPATSRYCALRGYDRAGAYTPLDASHDLSSEPLSQRSLTLPEGLAPRDAEGRLRITALGDVNGDGFDDVLIAGGEARELGGAALYLGSRDGLSGEPVLRFASHDSYELGFAAAALGNFDADPDGLMDFALAAPGSSRVFVVLGRTAFSPGTVVLDAGGCGADLCVQGDAPNELGRALASARFDLDDVPDLVAGDRRGAVVILGSELYTRVPRLGGSGAGTCLDARSVPGPDACGTGRSEPARGFRLEAPAPIDQAASPLRGMLFLGHDGSAQRASLWFARRRSYSRVDELVRVPSSELGLAFQANPGSLWRELSVVGDLNGDDLADLAWSSPQAGGLVHGYTSHVGGALTPVFSLVNDAPQGSEDAFGRALGTGAHPELGLLGDLEGDGHADLLVSADALGGAGGSVEVFGAFSLPEMGRPRSSRALSFDDTLLEPAPETAPYPRIGQYLGDTDGDGNPELGVLETNFAPSGRLIVLGECKGP